MLEFLPRLQERFEKVVEGHLGFYGADTPLRQACCYAMRSGGKRFRPALVYLVHEALGLPDCGDDAALAVELFHTASLIADDMPCMDNDDLRRGKPSLHKVYGDTVALLASYSLIASGYDCIARAAEGALRRGQPAEVSIHALRCATHNTGIHGACGGQYLDIFPDILDEAEVREAIEKKTVSLFEVAFVFGWVFGGGDLERLPEVKKLAYDFGMMFQLHDDLGDVEQDALNGRQVNFASTRGIKETLEAIGGQAESYRQGLSSLGLASKELLSIAEGLELHSAALAEGLATQSGV